MSQITKWIVNKFPFGPYARMQAGMRNPGSTQAEVLRGLMTRAVNTEFGQQKDFAGALREPDLVRAYQQRVPLALDAAYRTDLERMLHGEPDVLWPGKCLYGAISGGTTTHGKLFPTSRELLKVQEQFGLWASLAHLAEHGDLTFLKGKILAAGDMCAPNPAYEGLQCAAMSGVLGDYVLSKVKKPPKWMAVPPVYPPDLDWDGKLDYLARKAAPQDVRFVALLPSWGVQLLRNIIQAAQEQPGKNPQTVAEVWPNLRLITAGGYPLKPYRSTLETLVGSDKVQFRESYAATQAPVAYQTVGDDPSMQLWLGGGIFYEFVPWEEYLTDNPQRLTAGELQPGQLYVPYATNCSGLWSLSLEDIVRISDQNPTKLFVAGRTSEFLDVMGESVVSDQAQRCMEEACRSMQSVAARYHLAPSQSRTDRKMGHELFVEFEKEPLSLAAFTEAFDETMKEINPLYKKWRERGLTGPELTVVPAGTFKQWLANSRKEIHSQSKIPLASGERKIADALTELAFTAQNKPALHPQGAGCEPVFLVVFQRRV